MFHSHGGQTFETLGPLEVYPALTQAPELSRCAQAGRASGYLIKKEAAAFTQFEQGLEMLSKNTN